MADAAFASFNAAEMRALSDKAYEQKVNQEADVLWNRFKAWLLQAEVQAVIREAANNGRITSECGFEVSGDCFPDVRTRFRILVEHNTGFQADLDQISTGNCYRVRLRW